jgi:hypothetical protein
VINIAYIQENGDALPPLPTGCLTRIARAQQGDSSGTRQNQLIISIHRPQGERRETRLNHHFDSRFIRFMLWYRPIRQHERYERYGYERHGQQA